MKTIQKITALSAISLMLAVSLVSCNDQEKGKEELPINNYSFTLALEASDVSISSNVHTNANVAIVKAVISALDQNSGCRLYFRNNEIASAQLENGGFRLNIPETIPNEYLGSMRRLFDIFSYEGLSVSDIRVKTGDIYILAYGKAGNLVGSFGLVSDGSFAEFTWADRDFTEKGNFQSGIEADCIFHKGFNIVYNMWGENTKSTTEKPQNENFVWAFLPPPSARIAN